MNPTVASDTLTRALLRPASVALVGASSNPAKSTARPLRYLSEGGWTGTVYAINPSVAAIGAVATWPSLAALPETPDQVFVMTSADRAVEVVQECVRLGVPLVTIMSDGFAEAGPAGRARQDALVAAARGSSTRVLGPSSLGVVDVASRLTVTANAAFAEPLEAGPVFVVSQSGSMIGALASRGRALGVHFAGFVSTGGEADLSLGEVARAAAESGAPQSFALFMETLGDVGDLRGFALAAHERGIPVLAYKLGRTEAAAQLSQSHTGAIASDDAVADELLTELGIARVRYIDSLIEGQSLARRLPISSRPGPLRVCIVTTTGGGGAMLVDELGLRGVAPAAPSEGLRRRLADLGVSASATSLIDLTMAGADPVVVRSVLDELTGSEEFDVVVMVAGSSAATNPELTIDPVLAMTATSTPVAVLVVPHAPDAVRRLNAAGVSAFTSPHTCADVMSALGRRRVPVPRESVRVADAATRTLDEAESAGLLAELGVPVAPYQVVSGADEVSPELAGRPLAVKALLDELPHKSEHGGVVLRVEGPEAIARAIDAVGSNVAASTGRSVDRFFVQEMISGGCEVLLGYRIDPSAGPIVLLAAGGVDSELYVDRSLRLAPVTLDEAIRMTTEVRALDRARGFRNRPEGDLDALAQAIVALSRAAVDAPGVVEAEVNPLIVRDRGDGVVAVDAVVVTQREES